MEQNKNDIIRYVADQNKDLFAKGFRIVLMGGVLVTTAYIGKKMFKTYQEGKENRKYEDAIESLPVNASKATITSHQAQMFAQQLFSAMEGTGTDEDAIMKVFTSKNKDDLALMIKAFGVRPYGTFGAPMYSWLPSVNLDLIGWLRKELSGNNLQLIEQQLLTAGIT